MKCQGVGALLMRGHSPCAQFQRIKRPYALYLEMALCPGTRSCSDVTVLEHSCVEYPWRMSILHAYAACSMRRTCAGVADRRLPRFILSVKIVCWGWNDVCPYYFGRRMFPSQHHLQNLITLRMRTRKNTGSFSTKKPPNPHLLSGCH